MFGKVLIANRGEISVRIARALREMDVRSVAVYSDADRGALHTLVADEAYHIGPTPAAESYLDVERLIAVARESGAEAVHPGYGFLAESAPFARAVTEAGLVWIGPHPEAIVAMGSKVESRRIMAGAGVPITPGTADPVGSADSIHSRRVECPSTKQIELRPPVHAALDRFQPRDLAFRLSVRPPQRAARPHRRFVLSDLVGKALRKGGCGDFIGA